MSSLQHDAHHHSASEQPSHEDKDHQPGHTHRRSVSPHTPPTEHQAHFSAMTPQGQGGRGQYNAKFSPYNENLSVAPRRPDYGGRGQYDVVPDKPRDPSPKHRAQPVLGSQAPSLAGIGQQKAVPEGYQGSQHGSISARNQQSLAPRKNSEHNVTPEGYHPLHHSSTVVVQQLPAYEGRVQHNATPESVHGSEHVHAVQAAVLQPESRKVRRQSATSPNASRSPSPGVREMVSLGPQPPSSSGRGQYNINVSTTLAPSAAVRELPASPPQPPSTGGRGQYNASPDSSS